MKLHILQHVPFEGPAAIRPWARNRGHRISKTLMFEPSKFPAMADFDWLVILGGPMNIYEEKKYPWLVREKRFIEKAMSSGKKVLGICLGAQLAADLLGGQVRRNRYKEIGWHEAALTPQGRKDPVFGALPRRFVPFHWHGDTFEIPKGAVRAAESRGCRNQAFIYEQRIVGLQFHLETTPLSARKLAQNCKDEIHAGGKYIQKPAGMLAAAKRFQALSFLGRRFLDAMARTAD